MNLKVVHEALCASDANSHAGLRPMFTRQYGRQVGDPPALVADLDLQHLRRRLAAERIFDQATAAVLIGVACNLGDRCCDLGLFEKREAQLSRYLPGPLACKNYVGLLLQIDS